MNLKLAFYHQQNIQRSFLLSSEQGAIMYSRYKGFPKGNTQMNVSKFIMLTYFLPTKMLSHPPKLSYK